jgi:hypothetical protein
MRETNINKCIFRQLLNVLASRLLKIKSKKQEISKKEKAVESYLLIKWIGPQGSI